MSRRDVQLGRRPRLIVFAAICVFVAALYFGRDVLIPIALATLFTFVLFPLVQRLEKWGLNRATATMLVVLLALAAVGGIAYVVAYQVKLVAEVELPQAGTNIENKLGRLRSIFRPISKVTNDLEREVTTPGATSQPAATQPSAVSTAPLGTQNKLDETFGVGTGRHVPGAAPAIDDGTVQPTTAPSDEYPIPVRIVTPASPLASILGYVQSFLLGPLVTASVVVVLVIFMLLGREDLRDRLIRLFGDGQLNLTTQAIDEAASRIMRYLVAQSAVNICYGAAVSGGLWVIGRLLSPSGQGFPNWFLWGLLCAILRFVPYVGIWIAMVLPLALSFAMFQGNGMFIATISLFVAYELIVGQFVEPYLYGSSTGMSALAVLIAAVFWTALWGPIGLLLSTPMTVCLIVLGKYVPQLAFLNILLGDEPVLEPPVRIYQRLIALDQEEAAELIQQYLKEKSLEEVYDQVLMPALAMAERDRQHEELDEERREFVHRGLRELIEELGEQATVAAKVQATGPGSAAADAGVVRLTRHPLPKDCRVSVYCLPARDEADELAGMMLAQLLSLRGYCAESLSHEAFSGEILEQIEKNKIDIVCISALPPTATSDARALTKRLRARFAGMPLVVGIWTYKADLARGRRRISRDESVNVVTKLADAQESIDQLAHQVIAAAAAASSAAVANK
jgi:predicted PurR-regulated permease PerM